MGIKEFIQNEVLLPRLREAEVLVVYDPKRRYRELCLELATETRKVVDASESSIESREAALAALKTLGKTNPPLKGLLVYVPAAAPLTDEAKQRDPFAVYGVCGATFPEGDGDEYISLCLKANADQATEIRRIFNEDPNPNFAVIDAVGGGTGWPTMQGSLGVESARNILFALLVPSEAQRQALKGREAWVAEVKELFQNTLGLTLMTRVKSWGAVADELWRFILFSEFVFDLPEALPAALANVPCARPEAQHLVEDLCDRLRNDQRTQHVYIERAEAIQGELSLPAACQNISDLGERDTFPFEERSFFARAVDALVCDDLDKVRQILDRRTLSVWVGRGEHQAQWHLLGSAQELIQACADAERELPSHNRSQEPLVEFYVGNLREVDRLQREFEGAAGDYFDLEGQMSTVVAQARAAYRRLIEKVQVPFVRHLETSGWPPQGRLANGEVFDRFVAPKLEESGRRVALLLIDALRYELGMELHKDLAEFGQCEVQPAFAQLPTVTAVGMASLLPEASQRLRLIRQKNGWVANLDDRPLANVNQRMDVMRSRYGQRFAEKSLRDFVRDKSDLPRTVELLVLRSNEMDNEFESNPEAAPSLIGRTFQQVRVAVHRLRDLGFQDVVIATDHGFYLNTAIEPGDACGKPPGDWTTVHERILLGDGAADASNYALPADSLGIRGDFNQVAGPRAMVAYRAGQSYFHGGASLQEAVVPVINLRLHAAKKEVGKRPKVTLAYRRGAERITTRLPVFEVGASLGDLFTKDTPVDVLLEARDLKGAVVGEAKPGGRVNPATLTLSLMPGETVKVTLKMDLDFEGPFTVKALDPTTLTAFDSVALETDYTV